MTHWVIIVFGKKEYEECNHSSCDEKLNWQDWVNFSYESPPYTFISKIESSSSLHKISVFRISLCIEKIVIGLMTLNILYKLLKSTETWSRNLIFLDSYLLFLRNSHPCLIRFRHFSSIFVLYLLCKKFMQFFNVAVLLGQSLWNETQSHARVSQRIRAGATE